MSGSMHPQRALALSGGTPALPGSPSMNPATGPPPGFGNGPLVPPPGFGNGPLGPPGFGNGPPPGFGGLPGFGNGPPPGFGQPFAPLGMQPPFAKGAPGMPPFPQVPSAKGVPGIPPFPQGPPGKGAPFTPLSPPHHPNQFPPIQNGPPGSSHAGVPGSGPLSDSQELTQGLDNPTPQGPPGFPPQSQGPPGFLQQGPPGFPPQGIPQGFPPGPPFGLPGNLQLGGPFGGLPPGLPPGLVPGLGLGLAPGLGPGLGGLPFGAPGPFGPGFGRGAMPPFMPHQPLQPPFQLAPPPPLTQAPLGLAVPEKTPASEVRAPQIQMIEPPKLTRAGIPVGFAQNPRAAFSAVHAPIPIPAANEVDNKPLQFKNAAPTPQATSYSANGGVDDAWTEATTEEGAVYYYNLKTLESSWDVPKGYKVKSKPKPVSWEAIGDGKWKKVLLDNDQHYYFNTTTKESHWDVPEEVTKILEAEAKKTEAKGKRKDEGQDSDEEKGAKKPKTEDGSESKEDEQPKETEEEHQKNVETFKEMLRECKVAPFSKWEKELPKFVSDPRMKLITNHNERRAIFDQFARNRKVEEQKEKKAKTKLLHEGFRQLLEEHAEKFNPEFSFSAFKKLAESDSRWGEVDEKDRETLFNEKMAPFRKETEDKKQVEFEKAKKDFIDLLKENSVNSSTHWSRVKTKIDRDPRYRHHLLHSEQREKIFRDYVDSLEEDSAQRKKRDREEASKRDREREIKELRERENREMDKRREKLKREEEEVNFRSLLKEKIKEPSLTWKEALKMLDSDPRFKTHHLARDDKDKAFHTHIKSLQELRISDFKALLSETTLNVTIDWKHAKDILREDRRYEKVTSEREKQTVFDRHMREVRRKARDDFREMLKEHKFLWNRSVPLEGQIEQVKKVIRDDRRYAVWDSDKSERLKMIKEYIERLEKENQSSGKKLTVVDEENE